MGQKIYVWKYVCSIFQTFLKSIKTILSPCFALDKVKKNLKRSHVRNLWNSSCYNKFIIINARLNTLINYPLKCVVGKLSPIFCHPFWKRSVRQDKQAGLGQSNWLKLERVRGSFIVSSIIYVCCQHFGKWVNRIDSARGEKKTNQPSRQYLLSETSYHGDISFLGPMLFSFHSRHDAK